MCRLIQKQSVSRHINPMMRVVVSEKMLKLIQEILLRLLIKILHHKSKVSSM